jgi:hypothetical protein
MVSGDYTGYHGNNYHLNHLLLARSTTKIPIPNHNIHQLCYVVLKRVTTFLWSLFRTN